MTVDERFAEWWATTGLIFLGNGLAPIPGPRIGHPSECHEAYAAGFAAGRAAEWSDQDLDVLWIRFRADMTRENFGRVIRRGPSGPAAGEA